ncbi:hypothetical protein [Synechococcus sp. L2F]|uniref:hypothetical protein n=1 Tax=Synechococcus sp. L2F TaxID=2823739 RepID=UPI0020CDAAFB|nr:hypothetical protein [Synechococcus sp. L2F]
MRPPHWWEVAIESRPRAEKRVLALARSFHPHGTWAAAVDNDLRAYQLALRTASGFPLLGGRTTM